MDINENETIRSLYSKYPTEIIPHFTDKYGFIIAESTNIKNEHSSGEKWTALLEEKDIRVKSSTPKLIYKGIPLFLKYKVWSILLYSENNNNVNLNQFDYDALKSKKCNLEHQIHVDVQRTFRKHSLFFEDYGIGQIRLFNVLVAFANYRDDIGYCQGMSSFVGLILMYFPEKECFKFLITLLSKNKLEALFDKSLSKIPQILVVQSEVFRETIPRINRHLMGQKVDLTVFVFSWYLTLFSRFGIEMALRVWDLFLFYDFVVFLLFSAAILRYCKDKILAYSGEKLIQFIMGLESYSFDVEKIIKYVKEYIGILNLKKYRKDLGII